jgi:SAM-dependent methyltransferase
VLEVARGNARKAGVEDRYHLLPGSAFDVEYGGPYDIVLLTDFLHHFDPPTCVGLLRKVRAALRPGGRAAALEFVPNEDRVSPPIAAAFSLTMLASTTAGDTYAFHELGEDVPGSGLRRHRRASHPEKPAHPGDGLRVRGSPRYSGASLNWLPDGSVRKHHPDFELTSNGLHKLGKRTHVDVGAPFHPGDSGLL